MPIVRLTGQVTGRKDPNRRMRARLLYRLFDAGWDIYNGNGDQIITLNNVQEKIVESDAFVFTPGSSLEDMFHASSIFVGFQTMDNDLHGKTAAILNSDYSWDPFLHLIDHLNGMGTVKQKATEFLTIVNKPKKVVSALESEYQKGTHHVHAERSHEPDIIEEEIKYCDPSKGECPPAPEFNVCVFCSASINKDPYLDDGYALGKRLAEEGWGCVSGAGKTGIMGKVVRGSVENGGWTGGSNIPHIIALEGLPDGLNEFWPRGDIYTRMEVMIERSDAFIIMPGGLGTVQEMLALILMLEQGNDLMKGKHIVVVNRVDEDTGQKFWSPFIRILNAHGSYERYSVVNTIEQAIDKIKILKNK